MAVEVAGERYFTVQTHNITLSVTCLRKGSEGEPTTNDTTKLANAPITKEVGDFLADELR